MITTTRHPRPHAFTLVELIVVVGIISLLITLLIPAISTVKTQARKRQTDATINALSVGLEAYKAESEIGGAYPPSRPDQPTANQWYVASPYQDGARITYQRGLSGAGLLYWAMAGADGLGCPGFFDTDGDGFWADNTDAEEGGNGLYTIVQSGPNAGRPIYTRRGPYVDLEKASVTPRNPDDGGRTFLIPDTRAPLEMPVFLDAFGAPIIYYRANRGAGYIATDESDNPYRLGIYDPDDNIFITGGPGIKPGINEIRPQDVLNIGVRTGHPMGTYWENGATRLPPGAKPADFDWTPEQRLTFIGAIYNPAVQVTFQPKNPDTFLLISPGPDRRYGTGDDIANFEVNE